MMKTRLIIVLIIISSPLLAKLSDEIKASGIDFKHENGMTGKFYMPEIIGSGLAFFDYDNDGDMDLYLVQGGNLSISVDENTNLRDKLYRNDTIIQDHPVFVDVTESSKINS